MMARFRFLALLIGAGILAACGEKPAAVDQGKPVDNSPLDWELASRLNSEGVALMDAGRGAQAREKFEELVRRAPECVEGEINLAIALLNTTEKLPKRMQSDYDRSEALFRKARKRRPDLPHPPYCLGVLLDYRGMAPAVEVHTFFEEARKLAPKDPDTLYRLAEAKTKLSPPDREGAIALFREVIAFEPHFSGAWYAMSRQLRRVRDPKGSEEALSAFKNYQDQKPEVGKSLGLVYNSMGRYSEVIRVLRPFGPAALTQKKPRTPSLKLAAPKTLVAGVDAKAFPFGMSAAAGDDLRSFLLNVVTPGLAGGLAAHDLDGDGRFEFYVADGRGPGKIYRVDKDGGVEDISEAWGLQGDLKAVGGIFGDVDHDGDPDLFAYGAGADILFMNEGKTFRADLSLGGGDALTLFAQIVDADHDGDLDVLSAGFCALPPAGTKADKETIFPSDFAGAPNHLFNNNRPTIYQTANEGTASFTDIAMNMGLDPKMGLDDPARRTASLLAFDWDRDGDVDILEMNDGAENRLFNNHRLWQYRLDPMGKMLGGTGPAVAASACDIDQDGDLDLTLLRGPGAAPLLIENRYPAEPLAEAWTADLPGDISVGHFLACVDLDNSGEPDRVAWSAADPTIAVFAQTGVAMPRYAAALQAPAASQARGMVAVDLDGDGDQDLLQATSGGGLVLIRNDSPADSMGHRIELELRGKRVNDTASMWSNQFGVGTSVEVAAGTRRSYADTMTSNGYGSGPAPRVWIGLGSETQSEYVRTVWSDLVLQNESGIPVDELHVYHEVNRKASSCPVLFKYSGLDDDFEFVTDFLGVGGLGFLIDPDGYAPPDSTELVRIGDLPEKDGKLMLRIAEPMEEICYLDQFALIVVEHPENTTVHGDERLATAPPFPEGKAVAFEEAFLPRSAINARGEDTLEEIVKRDRIYQKGLEVDRRFVGYLAEENQLVLEFDADTILSKRPSPESRLHLFIDGWVEYPYSHVNFAGWQAEVRGRSLSLDVADGATGWKTLLPEFGYPAGMSRTMAVDISAALETGIERLRLRSNLEIYIDSLYLGWDVAEQNTVTRRFDFDRAELRFLGYPLEHSPDGRMPTVYDYQRISPSFDWKTLDGRYTRYGDVRDLIRTTDDRFVIMNHGDEIALEVDAKRLGPLKKGWKRTFFLEADGWCKDMDPYTAYPATVAPLPFHAMKNYPPGPEEKAPEDQDWQKTYNTRRIEGTWQGKAGATKSR